MVSQYFECCGKHSPSSSASAVFLAGSSRHGSDMAWRWLNRSQPCKVCSVDLLARIIYAEMTVCALLTALISKEPAVTMQERVDANASIPCQTGKSRVISCNAADFSLGNTMHTC